MKRQHLPSRRRRLAFERLEDRCLLSAQSFLSGNAGLLLPDQPGSDLHTNSLQAADPNMPLSVISPGSAISTVTLLASNGQNRQYEKDSQQALTQDDGGNPPDDPNALNSLAAEQNVAADNTSQNQSTQEIGVGLLSNGNSETLSGFSIDNLSPGDNGQGFHVSLFSAGGVSAAHSGIGLQNPFPNSENLGSNGRNAGTKLVSSGVRDLRLSPGTLPDQKTTFSLRDLHSSDGAITVTPIRLGNALSNPLSVDVPLEIYSNFALAGGAWNGVNSFENKLAGFGEVAIGWLTADWTGRIQYTQVDEIAGYADAGSTQRDSFNPSPLNVAGERLLNVNPSAGVNGTDRGPQVQVYPVSAGVEARSDMPSQFTGRENDLIEKPITGISTLASSLPAPAFVADTAPSPAAEFSQRNPAPSLGVTTLMGEAARWQDLVSQDSRIDRQLVNSPLTRAADTAHHDAVFASMTVVNITDRFELFSSDVVATVSARTEAAGLTGTSGTTSIYLANEESSIWSILTTYALVIMPRQRKPQPTILVVDPDDASREALNVVLVREGYFVLPAASVRDAWGMFRTPHARIDLVLLDPHLPDVSGIHLCARLRELSPTLPVMVCAGEVEPAEVARLQELGVRYYLRKPIAVEELLHTVKAILP